MDSKDPIRIDYVDSVNDDFESVLSAPVDGAPTRKSKTRFPKLNIFRNKNKGNSDGFERSDGQRSFNMGFLSVAAILILATTLYYGMMHFFAGTNIAHLFFSSAGGSIAYKNRVDPHSLINNVAMTNNSSGNMSSFYKDA